jgi:hypothetical protein
MIGEVLKNFEIYLHQLTPNAIIRLSVYIWALRSQGKSANAEGFCRVHELHYQTKARADGLHKNFRCYNFSYRKDTKAPVIGYHTKWPAGWTNEWFYVKANEKKREKLMPMVMSPLRMSFDMTRPLCNMQLGSPCELAEVEFRVVAEHISTRDLVQEYMSNKTFPTSSGWGMSKKKEGNKYELVRLTYRFKFQKSFGTPCAEWLELIETMCNDILGNYIKKDDQLMTAAFGTREIRRLNGVMDALNFEYPDYERFDEGAEGAKKKRVVSILKRHAIRSIEKDQKAAKKNSAEPKDSASKKRKSAMLAPAETKVPDVLEKTIGTSSSISASVNEILKVMTKPFPFAMLSPLGSDLTSLLQSKEKGTEKISEGKKITSAIGEMLGVRRNDE